MFPFGVRGPGQRAGSVVGRASPAAVPGRAASGRDVGTPPEQRRPSWGELVGRGFTSYVRTIPRPPIGRFVQVSARPPSATTGGDLCPQPDPVSPFGSIRGAAP